ncbi:hypothetical protein ACFOSU_15535 [Salinisphaera aquimarina]|uniref:Lipoprotein n=2 Tax=Salinisphaera aquimarina TaxID=2094031 RepID=A0ABV7ERB2_9GAMM
MTCPTRNLIAIGSVVLIAGLAGCSAESSETAGAAQDLTSRTLRVPTAYVPPQCYTKTTLADGSAANTCYSCHTNGRKPNFINDTDLQLAYDFANPMRTARKGNPWTNLFVDRSDVVAAVSDADILAYVRESNYRGPDGDIALADRLTRVPKGWDANRDGHWSGFVPDVGFDFDNAGFDHAANGDYTGWRAYAYTPLPGSFLPTNGSFDDVLIRLPEAFRQGASGQFDADIYALNFAIVESVVKQRDVPIDPVDENDVGVDLNRDGRLDQARQVTFDWAPREGRDMSWVGRARSDNAKLAAGLFPKGTEFIHTLRYLDVNDDGKVVRGARMKELRYARKQSWFTYSDLRQKDFLDAKEAHDFPNRPERFRGDVEHGLANGVGWVYQGFIEDARGDLRPQTFAETTSCMGCHGGVGATTDSTFSFARKLDASTPGHGWTWWDQRPVASLPEPLLADGRPEYATYLKINHAGDEFRSNFEIIDRFFNADGSLKQSELNALKTRIGALVLPSADRATSLDKAYRAIVREQSFEQGRAAHVQPMPNVYRQVLAGQSTGIDKPLVVGHDSGLE